MQGPLAEGVLPGLLRELYVGRKTGHLYFTRPGRSCCVLFRGGHIVQASTDDPEDWLGEVLVRNALITREQFEEASRTVEREHKRLGSVLREQDLLSQERLEEGMAMQVRQLLFRVFSWPQGNYRFAEADSVGAGEVTLKVSTGDMILEAVRRVHDPEAVRRALGDLDRVLSLSSDPLLRFQNVTLTPADGYLLSCVDGSLTARQVLQQIPLDAEDASRSLFGLLCTGVIEHVNVPAPASAAARGAAPGPGSTPPRPSPGPLPAPPPPASPALQAEERRREVLDKFDGLRRYSHFEMLGVPRTAGSAEVKEAYFRLAKRFHPDAHHDASLSDLSQKLEAVFIRLGEAYEVLRHDHSRASYERTLPRAGVPAPAPPVAEPPPGPARERDAAPDRVRQAEKHLAEGRYWDAIQLFEGSLEHLDRPFRQRALLGLSRALMKNPNWVKRAEETLQELLRDEPRQLDALLELGLLYEASGLKSRALATFRRLLELEPAHEQARVRVSSLAGPEEDPPPGGLLKKLFRR